MESHVFSLTDRISYWKATENPLSADIGIFPSGSYHKLEPNFPQRAIPGSQYVWVYKKRNGNRQGADDRGWIIVSSGAAAVEPCQGLAALRGRGLCLFGRCDLLHKKKAIGGIYGAAASASLQCAAFKGGNRGLEKASCKVCPAKP